MRASMSAQGHCYDNAPMVSFWSPLKMALVFHRHVATRKQAMQEITELIEIFHRQRIQQRSGTLSPAAFERQYNETTMGA